MMRQQGDQQGARGYCAALLTMKPQNPRSQADAGLWGSAFAVLAPVAIFA